MNSEFNQEFKEKNNTNLKWKRKYFPIYFTKQHYSGTMIRQKQLKKKKKKLLTINLIKIYAKILNKILASQIQQYINIRKLNQLGFIM